MSAPASRGARWRALLPRRQRFAQPPSAGFVVLYVVLGAVTVGTLALYAMLPEHPVVNDFGPELATNALAILVTLVFVQRLMDRQEWRRRLRGSIGGLRQGARALSRLQNAWATVLKGCLPAIPVERRDTTDGLFLDTRSEELMCLDPRAQLHPARGAALAWLAAEVGKARDELRSVARQYAGGFDVEYLEALEELVDDSFLEMVVELGRQETSARDWRLRINSARGARARHFSQLRIVLELHNEIAAEAARVRSSRPQTRELGIAHAADHDLRIETALPAKWWSEAPAAGSLREVRQPPAPSPKPGPR
jgi:hypothetical protein